MTRFAVLACWNLLMLSAPLTMAAQTVPPLRLDRPAWTASQSFTTIVALRELRDGRVLLTDIDDRQLYLIGPTGQTIAPLGRLGSGPVEYTVPTNLVALPGDSTLLLDRDARRFLLIDPAGRIVATTPFPLALTSAAPQLRGADPKGRLYFEARVMSEGPDGVVSLIRWDRRTGRIDSVATVQLPAPRPVALPGGGTMRRIMPYTPADDWGVAPSGRVVLVRVDPYRLEWIAFDGTNGRGPIVAANRVLVTNSDKQTREPKGPPFRLQYPESKPPFVAGYTVFGPDDQTLVARYPAAGSATMQWELFDQSGKLVGTQTLASNKRVLAITRRFVYLIRTDSDDLQWLEAYARQK